MGKLLWTPSDERVKNSNMYRFMSFVNERHQQTFTDYDGLYAWSVSHIPEFWAAVWDFVGIKASRGYDRVIDDERKMPGAKWFPGARLNFAENLLRFRDDSVALIFKGEDHPTVKMTYAQLYDEVARLAKSLKACGVGPGDRVVGFLPNMPEAVTAMLAATSLGAVWSSCSPDFGIKGVLDRFGQIKTEGSLRGRRLLLQGEEPRFPLPRGGDHQGSSLDRKGRRRPLYGKRAGHRRPSQCRPL